MDDLICDESPVRPCQSAGAALENSVQISSALPEKAKRRGLNRLRLLRSALVGIKRMMYTHLFGMNIHPSAEFSLSARLDRTFPIGVHIGETSYVAFEACILTHDRTRGLYLHTWVGRNCFIGARSVVLPGIRVGDGSIVAAGAIVTKDVPAHCLVAGNPARVIRQDIATGLFGRLNDADTREARLAQAGLT
ncbi:acetyltransferase-like isoleucine patch superfamily enzyme [Litoreibacter meonggei]|uniref:Acetyltransferase-like isoleucine patch superfamily enzyme n=1 Tax=Litoreibacter meonggei TaxID=1049199 RepID=A0A497VD67_9RHOB|nr:acyltransferase [Litoreibacter meonggei]RLJ41430.1 acetyltransferase-like isoleucine patch superfamily enzyme [Litoreibacter meonggei]